MSVVLWRISVVEACEPFLGLLEIEVFEAAKDAGTRAANRAKDPTDLVIGREVLALIYVPDERHRARLKESAAEDVVHNDFRAQLRANRVETS